MSASINTNLLKQFIIKQVGAELDKKEAQALGMQDQFDNAALELDKDELNFNEIVMDTDLYEQFATLYTVEQDKKANAKDKEQEKQEQTQVKDKNGAGV